tara:strand:+ start:2627 stop:2896 length:270 start_codon:yes stop_codon:yes gene_type:complete
MKQLELKKIIRKIIKESLKDRLGRLVPARRPNKKELELANQFAKKQGGSLDSIGVNKFSGEINIRIDDQGYILDKDGNFKAEIVTTFNI